MYGDGVFETMRVRNNRIVFKEYHIERLQSAMTQLGLNSGKLDPNLLEEHINDLTVVNQEASARVRLVVFRTGSGNYRSESDQYSWMAESEELDSDEYPGVDRGLMVGTSENAVVHKHSMSGFKTISALCYVIAGSECFERGLDDLVIPDPSGRPSEAISSNIFFLKETDLFTPGLEMGCVDGVIRRVISDKIIELGYSLKSCTITPALISSCSSMYLTNSVSGIQWVADYDGKTFEEGPYKSLLNFLNKIS